MRSSGQTNVSQELSSRRVMIGSNNNNNHHLHHHHHHQRLTQKALERKNNKPIMEKKRRARINHCLNQLKALILETDNERSRHSKLEKADILEMTVRYLQTLRAYHLHLQQLNHQLTLQHSHLQQQHQHQLHAQPQQQHQLFHSPLLEQANQHPQQPVAAPPISSPTTNQLLHLQLPLPPVAPAQPSQLALRLCHLQAQNQQQQPINHPQVSPLRHNISPTWRPW